MTYAGLLFLALVSQDAKVGSFENPVLCDGVKGEHWYLSRLRTPDGKRLKWSRQGSFGQNKKHPHILDGYTVGDGDRTVFIDLYHPGVIDNRAPKGLRLLTEWSERYEYVDRRIHALGEDAPFTGKVREESGEGEEKRIIEVAVKDGWIRGSLSWLYADGQVMKRTEYAEKNVPHGTESWFRSDGAPWAVFHYRNGARHGTYAIYDEEGKVTSSGEYKKGVLKEEGKEE